MKKNIFVLAALIWALTGFRARLFAAEGDVSLRTLFLKGDYSACCASARALSPKAGDEEYYLAGLSCLKSGAPEEALRLLEALLKDFPRSPFREAAMVGIADSLFLKGDLDQARRHCESFLSRNLSSNLRPGVYYRLYLFGKKSGDLRFAAQYRERLRQEFPASPEAGMEGDIFPPVRLPAKQLMIIPAEDIDDLPENNYSIQVGAFSKKANADRLAARLKAQGYPAYIEKMLFKGAYTYKVKVGRFEYYPDARKLGQELAAAGYPTKIDTR